MNFLINKQNILYLQVMFNPLLSVIHPRIKNFLHLNIYLVNI